MVYQSPTCKSFGHFFPPNFKLFLLQLINSDSFRQTAKGLSHTYTCVHIPPDSLRIQTDCHITLSRTPFIWALIKTIAF